MRHDWIFDVLTDLRAYAEKNDLPLLAAQADAALRVARAEIAARAQDEDEPGNDPPPGERRH